MPVFERIAFFPKLSIYEKKPIEKKRFCEEG